MMKEVKFYYIERVTEDILKEARNIATEHNCVVRLLWQPNRWNPEQKITITSDTTDDNIRTIQEWSRGPWECKYFRSMKEQVLSIEQMIELETLGIDTSKASMRWVKFNKVPNMRYQLLSSMSEDNDDIDNFEIIPTFTLQDVLEMLPNFHLMSINYNNYIGYTMNVCSSDIENFGEILHTESCMEEINNILEAAFNMLKWCKQNKHI